MFRYALRLRLRFSPDVAAFAMLPLLMPPFADIFR